MKAIQSSATLDRIYTIISSFRGQLIPAEVVVSQETYTNIVSELNIKNEAEQGPDVLAMLRCYLSVPVVVRTENTDVIVAKELFPNPCPVCGRRIPFLREMIERIESRVIKRIRCPLGHRYEGEIKIYYLDIYHKESPPPKPLERCPCCGSENLQPLSQTDVFCVDCEWDNLKRMPHT